jgi:hypothetical protein
MMAGIKIDDGNHEFIYQPFNKIKHIPAVSMVSNQDILRC